jgi:hemerythrin-like domain-containing protein
MANRFFQVLKEDHREVKSILEKLVKAEGKEREKMFLKLGEELVPHMKAEEKVFYTRLIRVEKGREHGMEGMEEHHVAELVLKELQKMSKEEDRWSAKLSVFKELINHHIQEEEGSIFKTAETVLKEEELQEILRGFEQEKQKIRKEGFKSAA